MTLSEHLKQLGITTVTIRFSGGGDSGQVDDIQYDPPLKEADKITFQIEKKSHFYDADLEEFIPQTSQVTVNLEEALDQFAMEWAESTGVDWYNNEGGCGSVTIDLTQTPPTFTGEIDQYVVHIESAAYEEDVEFKL